jgi:hypothetical protein
VEYSYCKLSRISAVILKSYKNYTYSNASWLIRSDFWIDYTVGIDVVGQDIDMSIIELSALIYLKDIAASVTRAVG